MNLIVETLSAFILYVILWCRVDNRETEISYINQRLDTDHDNVVKALNHIRRDIEELKQKTQ